MSKAEEYIALASDEIGQLCDTKALKAVEIEREEVIEKTLDFLKNKLYESDYIGIMDLCDEYIKTMKDE